MTTIMMVVTTTMKMNINMNVEDRYKLYLISYCESNKVYSQDNGLVNIESKDVNSYINDSKEAKMFKEEISNAKTIEDIEAIAVRIHISLKSQKDKN